MKIITILISVFYFFLISCTANEKEPQKKGSEPEEFSVMSFNVLYSTSVSSTLETIRATHADIIGLQEASEKRIEEVADSLGYNYHSFDKTSGNLSNDDTGVLSRYPIKDVFDNGVMIQLTDDITIAVFSVHLSPYPYEPYDIRDEKITTSVEAIQSAEKTRLAEITPVLETIDSLIDGGTPVFLNGDFNEPSHLDWTEAAAAKGLHFGKAIEWPISKAVIEAGLEDSYRLYHQDEVEKPGITWTTNQSDNEVYDRIDFVYHHLQNNFKLIESKRVGKPGNQAVTNLKEYESDHFAVMTYYSVL